MFRTFKYRLKPTPRQEEILFYWLKLTRELYNASLEERKTAWKRQKISISRIDQENQISEIRKERLDIDTVPNVFLRGALRRLEKAFNAFFRRCREGGKPGFPRFKSFKRWVTLECFDLHQENPICAGGNRIKIPNLGKVKFNQHRPIQGRPRTMKITLEGDGHWYVSLGCDEVPKKILPSTGVGTGMDVGITTFAALSNFVDKEDEPNPRFLEQAENEISRQNRIISKRKKGSNRRKKAALALKRKYYHLVQRRRLFVIRLAIKLLKKYDMIGIEDLNIAGLQQGILSKQVADAAWGLLRHWLIVKAEEAGRWIVGVNPCGSSQTCSKCLMEVRKTLKDRIHKCPHCGYVEKRDTVSAEMIYLGALEQIRLGTAVNLADPEAVKKYQDSRKKKFRSTKVRTQPSARGARSEGTPKTRELHLYEIDDS